MESKTVSRSSRRMARTLGQLGSVRPRNTHGAYKSGPAPGINVAHQGTKAEYKKLAKSSGSKSLRGKTVFMTGGSRGIGLAIALACARQGANIVIAAKTVKAHPRLPGTIFTAAAAIEKAGGQALAVQCDIRFEEQVRKAVEAGVAKFGGIDICINNASAISLTPTEATTMKKYDLMNMINARGTFLTSKCCIPYLKKSDHGHILNLSPPLNMETRWFAPHTAYSMAKYGMSMCVLGMAGELEEEGISVNALWPKTTIATAAVNNLLGGQEMMRSSRTPEIMGDAAVRVLTCDSSVTGNFFVDEPILRAVGVTDFSKYAVVKGTPDSELTPDFFI